MARIIIKSNYLKPSVSKKIGGYIRYISTRDGVEKIIYRNFDNTVSKIQTDMINEVLKLYPNMTSSDEYIKFLSERTRITADNFIRKVADENPKMLGNREKYVEYIATRPRAEKITEHGLFSDEGIDVSLSKVQKEVAQSGSEVWTHIISLTREDAYRLGYDNAESWVTLLRSKRNMIARNMKIDEDNFRWYAAFHNESYHPHVHLVAYSIKPNEAYLTEKGIEKIKSSLANEIFKQDLYSIYDEQTKYRDTLKTVSKNILDELVNKLKNTEVNNQLLIDLFIKLHNELENVSGKKVYGYLKPNLKSLVDAIVDEIEKDDRVSKLYDLWYEQRYNVLRTYKDEMPQKIPLASNKEFKSIKNQIIKTAQKINFENEIVNKSVNTKSNVQTVYAHTENKESSTIPLKKNPIPNLANLFAYIGNLFKKNLADKNSKSSQSVDKKLKREIDEKKQSMGIQLNNN